uniref:Uncharacterized protein n=1 Tax=viral metagenome TaxID=1070528 RepID=A0A6C0HTK7_9ZZZZ
MDRPSHPSHLSYDTDSSNESSLLLYESDDIISEEQEEDSFISYDDEDDDYSISTEEEIEFDTLFEEESEHLFQEKVDKQYYIGLATQIEGDDFLVMANTISTKGFLKNPYHKLLHYLWLHSIIRVKQPKIDILKLVIRSDGVYTVVIKTFWLRVFQRRWKRIFRESQEKLMKRKSLNYLKIREITSKKSLYNL